MKKITLLTITLLFTIACNTNNSKNIWNKKNNKYLIKKDYLNGTDIEKYLNKHKIKALFSKPLTKANKCINEQLKKGDMFNINNISSIQERFKHEIMGAQLEILTTKIEDETTQVIKSIYKNYIKDEKNKVSSIYLIDSVFDYFRPISGITFALKRPATFEFALRHMCKQIKRRINQPLENLEKEYNENTINLYRFLVLKAHSKMLDEISNTNFDSCFKKNLNKENNQDKWYDDVFNKLRAMRLKTLAKIANVKVELNDTSTSKALNEKVKELRTKILDKFKKEEIEEVKKENLITNEYEDKEIEYYPDLQNE